MTIVSCFCVALYTGSSPHCFSSQVGGAWVRGYLCAHVTISWNVPGASKMTCSSIYSRDLLRHLNHSQVLIKLLTLLGSIAHTTKQANHLSFSFCNSNQYSKSKKRKVEMTFCGESMVMYKVCSYSQLESASLIQLTQTLVCVY